MKSLILFLLFSSVAWAGGEKGYVDGHYTGPSNPTPQTDLGNFRGAPHYPGYNYSPSMVPNPDAGRGNAGSVPQPGAEGVANCANHMFGMIGQHAPAPDFSDIVRHANQLRSEADTVKSQSEKLRLQIDSFDSEASRLEKMRLAQESERATRRLQAPTTALLSDAVNRIFERKSQEAHVKLRDQLREYETTELSDEIRTWGTFTREKKSVFDLLDKFANEATRLQNSPPPSEEIQSITKASIQSGLNSLTEATKIAGGHREGNFADALGVSQSTYEIGKAFLDFALGIDPITGFGRSTYELFTGKNFVTGETLNAVELGFAFLGVATLGGANTARAATRMFHVFEGAGRLLRERAVFQAAIHEGQILYDRVGHLLPGFTKNSKILNVHTAEHINTAKFPHWLDTPPFQLGSHVVEFKTLRESQWVRVHTGGNETGNWIMRKSSIHGLTPHEIQVKYALPSLPTYVSDVHVPSKTTILRGNIQNHGLGGEGMVQYYIDITRDELRRVDWFRNMRPL